MPRALKYMGGEHTRMCGRDHRCTSSRIAPWHTHPPPLALTDYENVVAQHIASEKRCVFNFTNNEKWSYTQRVSRVPHCTPFRVVPWYTRNLPLAADNYINTCTHVKHIALFSRLREDFTKNRRNAQIAHGPTRLRCVDGLFTWCWYCQRVHRYDGSRIFLTKTSYNLHSLSEFNQLTPTVCHK